MEEELILNSYRTLTRKNSPKKWKLTGGKNVGLSIGFYRDRLYAGNNKFSSGWKVCVDVSFIFPLIKDLCFNFAWPWEMVATPSYRCLKGVDFVLVQGDPLKAAQKLIEMKKNGVKGKDLKETLTMAAKTVFDHCNFMGPAKMKLAFKVAWDFGSNDAVGDNKDAKTRCIMNDKGK